MKRVLFVSNGHGENTIALRLARETAETCARRGIDARFERFPLVGLGANDAAVPVVGPRLRMPSGGLVAMGNVRAFAGDLRHGFAGLFAEQMLFLRERAREVDVAVAVGDVYGLLVTLQTRRPVVFVGTAKSVFVAPYGPFERTVLRRASRIFVRDSQTAVALVSEGVPAEAPGNVIVDLALEDDGARIEGEWIGLLPGSRKEAYVDAVRLAAVYRALRAQAGAGDALLSIAPELDGPTVGRLLAEDGWAVLPGVAPAGFTARSGSARIVAWRGSLGAILRASVLAAGQAGTANEMAAAIGLPVVALDVREGRREDWYRMRQRKLLGDALAIVPADPQLGAAAMLEILRTPIRLDVMRRAGPARMGPPGGARAIAGAIADALENAA